ncbi:MAG: DNA polymerase III subunit alpha, partial [Deltaproteobacteria bacterium]|nr:DNA polymerase III subunit alpha [Deltaproteobacteria bacterium]
MTFVHLHVHSEFSMLDATTRIPQVAERAKLDGAPAVALTDHNNMFGAVDFLKACKKAGVRPIYGAEVNIVHEDRAGEARRAPTVVLLCKSLLGYRNLCFLLSRAYMDSPSKAPVARIDRPLLESRKEGLIALSGSLSGEIPQHILRGQIDEARELARHYQGVFGKDGFYLEILRNGIKEQERVNDALLRISEEFEIPVVAAADAHYAKREDAAAHEILMCIQLGKSLPSLDTKARITDELYLAPAAEMEARFADMPEAIANTEKIADMCRVEIPLGKTFLPTYKVPEGFDTASYMAHVSRLGLAKRLEKMRSLGQSPDQAVYEARLELEIECIAKMGFPGYFLIVWDFIDYAKQNGIPVGPGRGSGAGSLVAYSLGITDIDPIRYTLLFERFLNPERVSMPDFDIDFCMNKRDRVIHYVTQKYGEDQVGQIITYGTMKAKAVVRDVARTLGMSFAEADRAAKLIPEELGMTLEKAFEVEKRLKELVAEDERYAKLFEYARILEGMNRQPGIHAAGVVIGDAPLWEYVPLYAVKDENGRINRITQFAKNEVEEAGLVKFDFLGLKTLTVIDHALRLVNARRAKEGKEPLDIAAIDLADAKVYQLISGGHTTGVFQLESSGFKELLRKLKPDCIEDIIAAVALYRPGPLQSGMVDSFIRRKHGQEPVAYPHPSLDIVLKETYGVMVYQEQVMQSASVLAGFSLGQADILRRAMGKKKAEEMAKQRAVFAAGCAERGVDEKQASEIFDTIEKFAGYGFNKSHSAAYGIITYQTAWLKTHYPVEFMAALLTSDGDSTDKIVRLIAECRTMGLTVLPPSVNISDLDFTTGDGAIRFGMGAVKGVGGGAVEAILAARDEGGAFKDLYDFCERADLKRVNKRVMEALVKCGAFDELGQTRRGLWDELDRAIERGQTAQRDKQAGQFSLFGALMAPAPKKKVEVVELVMKEEWPDKERLSFEKECLGFYVSGHPLDRYAADLSRMGMKTIVQLDAIEGPALRDEVTVAGVIGEVRERISKNGGGRM